VTVLSPTGTRVLAETPFPPNVNEFYPPSLLNDGGVWLTKITLLVWLAVAIIIVFFLMAYRQPKLVPTKTQWIAESFYGFVRNNIAKDMIGHEGVRFAPYLATLFAFILLTNLFGLIPLLQLSPNSHIAFPIVLAVISYVMFIYVGIRRHGVGKFFKTALIPPAPAGILPILIPIEFFSTFLVRPVTLALRLFANMFAGHMILLVFTLGGFALLNADSLLVKPISLLSWAMTLALFALEIIVALLQAYVFVVLTSSYIQGALADEH
jgi:F-type H+-transporting ATPase subunit a